MDYITRTEVKIDFDENELQALSEAQAVLNEMYLMVKNTHVERLTFDGTDYNSKDINTTFSLLSDILMEFNYCNY